MHTSRSYTCSNKLIVDRGEKHATQVWSRSESCLLVSFFAVSVPSLLGWAKGQPSAILADLTTTLIPQSGSVTSYGIPLSVKNTQVFADWFYQIQLSPLEKAVVEEELISVSAPCCDDNSVLACCCSKNGNICNLTRSAQGLAAFLVHNKGFSGDATKVAVIEWLHFLHPNYYLATALEEQGRDPNDFGLEASESYESCYQDLCEAPLDRAAVVEWGLR